MKEELKEAKKLAVPRQTTAEHRDLLQLLLHLCPPAPALQPGVVAGMDALGAGVRHPATLLGAVAAIKQAISGARSAWFLAVK